MHTVIAGPSCAGTGPVRSGPIRFCSTMRVRRAR